MIITICNFMVSDETNMSNLELRLAIATHILKVGENFNKLT